MERRCKVDHGQVCGRGQGTYRRWKNICSNAYLPGWSWGIRIYSIMYSILDTVYSFIWPLILSKHERGSLPRLSF